jgi:hypothetical protein
MLATLTTPLDCMSRSYVIFPGIDLGYWSPPQSAWTFFKPPHL